MFICHFVDLDRGFEIFFEKVRHLYTLVSSVEENFGQNLSAFCSFLMSNKNSFEKFF